MTGEKESKLVEYFTELVKKASSNAIKKKDFDALGQRRITYGVFGEKKPCPAYQVETNNPNDYLVLLKVVQDMYNLPSNWASEIHEHEIEHYLEAKRQYSDPAYDIQHTFSVRFIKYNLFKKGVLPTYTKELRHIDDLDTTNKKFDAISSKPHKLSKGDLADLQDPRASTAKEEEWA